MIWRKLGCVLVLVLFVGWDVFTVRSNLKSETPEVEQYVVWDASVVDEARAIMVHEGGRVKPFETWASFAMLETHGQRSMKVLSGGKKIKIEPTAWMLDVMFRPEEADRLPTFRFDNSAILEQAGMKVKDLRDRYSFNDLRPYLHKLGEQYENLKSKKKPEKLYNLEERQLRDVNQVVSKYLTYKNMFRPLKDEKGVYLVSDLFRFAERKAHILAQPAVQPHEKLGRMIALNEAVLRDLALRKHLMQQAPFDRWSFFPSEDLKDPKWSSAGQLFAQENASVAVVEQNYMQEYQQLTQSAGKDPLAQADQLLEGYMKLLSGYEKAVPELSPALMDKIKLLERLQEAMYGKTASGQVAGIKMFKESKEVLIAQRGEGGKVRSELLLNKMDYFFNSWIFMLMAMVVLIIYLIAPQSKVGRVAYWVAFVLAVIGCGLVVAGVTHRSILMGRPPVGTLFDTIPFIVGTAMLVLLWMEWLTRKGILLGVSVVFGMIGIFLARSHEMGEATDQMGPMRAVLDSNYWLTIHVITITLGYMGGLVAAAISHVYIIGRAFGLYQDAKDRRFLTRSTYGMIAFTLVFSLIGTVLGGIWAAESWGRFWGWDPKENGAMMIVLWTLAVLHARAGGYIREYGLHLCSVFGAIVIAFSWWHVNYLSVGLHSYGFSEGNGLNVLYAFYLREVLVILLGLGTWMWLRAQKKAAIEKAAEQGS